MGIAGLLVGGADKKTSDDRLHFEII